MTFSPRPPKPTTNRNASLSRLEAAEILRARGTAPITELTTAFAERFDVAPSTVWRILRGKSWVHVEPTIERQAPKNYRMLTADDIETIRKLARRHKPNEVAQMVGASKRNVYRVIRFGSHRALI